MRICSIGSSDVGAAFEGVGAVWLALNVAVNRQVWDLPRSFYRRRRSRCRRIWCFVTTLCGSLKSAPPSFVSISLRYCSSYFSSDLKAKLRCVFIGTKKFLAFVGTKRLPTFVVPERPQHSWGQKTFNRGRREGTISSARYQDQSVGNDLDGCGFATPLRNFGDTTSECFRIEADLRTNDYPSPRRRARTEIPPRCDGRITAASFRPERSKDFKALTTLHHIAYPIDLLSSTSPRSEITTC